MNGAYRAWLERQAYLLDGHGLDHDQYETILDFLDLLDDRPGEPGVYEYGDAQNQYALAYIDEQSLKDWGGIDPDQIDDQARKRLLKNWVDTAADHITDEDWYDIRIKEALSHTIDVTPGINPDILHH